MKKRIQDQIDELTELLNIEMEILNLEEQDADEMAAQDCRANIAALKAEIARLTGKSDAE